MPDNESEQNPWLQWIPELDDGRRFPSLDPDKAEELFGELLAAGKGATLGIIGCLREVDDGKDWKARFVLGALASHVSGPGRDQERRDLESWFAGELAGERSAGVKTFLAMQMQWFAGAAAVPALAAQIGSPDAGLRDAAAAALTAIGSSAVPALRDARDKVGGDASVTVDHALAQIARMS